MYNYQLAKFHKEKVPGTPDLIGDTRHYGGMGVVSEGNVMRKGFWNGNQKDARHR